MQCEVLPIYMSLKFSSPWDVNQDVRWCVGLLWDS